MSLKIFGVLITTNALLKAVEEGSVSAAEAAVAAVASSSDPNAKAVATAVQAKITALQADTTLTGAQKLEEAAADALQVLGQYGFTATKDFAIALVQNIYNKGVSELETVATNILVKLGIEKTD